MSKKQYIFSGRTFNSIGEFAELYYDHDVVKAEEIMTILINQGKMRVVTPTTKEEMIIEKAYAQEEAKAQAEDLYIQEETDRQFRVDQRRAGKLTYDAVDFDFGTLHTAQAFEQEIKNLGIASEINIVDGVFKAVAKNITEADVTKLSMSYKAQKVVGKTLDVVDRTAQNTVGAVSYTAEKVLVPTVTVAGKAGVSIGKTIVKTGVKTGSTLLTAIFRGVKETASEVKNDADVIKAKYELLNTKEEIARAVIDRKGNIGGSGITVR